MPNFCKKTPCNNCPYRKDAPIKYWSLQEFKDLLKKEDSQMGTIYGCHKKNGHVCVGWLMNQDKNNLPSISLRISLSRNEVKRDYLNNLKCKSELFESVLEMCIANYPNEFNSLSNK